MKSYITVRSLPVSSVLKTAFYEKEIYVVNEDDTFPTINEKILSSENKRRATVVVYKNGKVSGLIRSIDLINAIRDRYKNPDKEKAIYDLKNMTAWEIMELKWNKFPCVSINATIGDVIEEMKRCKELKPHKSKDVVVVGENGEYCGFLTDGDILSTLRLSQQVRLKLLQ
jgi:predicted transcriptional regulator